LYAIGTLPADLATNLRVALRDQYNSILLSAAHLDTTKPAVRALRTTVGAFQGKRMHLVHFAGPVLPAWREFIMLTWFMVMPPAWPLFRRWLQQPRKFSGKALI
jgi:hypothetical protein